MPGFSNGIMAANNVDFRGVQPVVGQVTADGQLLIGSTAAPYIKVGTLTAGTGIGVTNASGSITLSSISGGFAWTDATNASYALSVQNGYVTDRGGGVTFTLPATASRGDIIKIVGLNGLWTIAQNANQYITLASSTTSVGIAGSLVATNVGDCIELVCVVPGASTGWRVTSVIGNITIN
jgi:hypothetical protein